MEGVRSPVKRFILHFPCDCKVGHWSHLGLLLRWPELTHILKIYKKDNFTKSGTINLTKLVSEQCINHISLQFQFLVLLYHGIVQGICKKRKH
jgi:hypothetical protein